MRTAEVISLLVVLFLSVLIMPLICAVVADRRNRNPLAWFLLGFLSIITLMVLLLITADDEPVVDDVERRWGIANRTLSAVLAVYICTVAVIVVFFLVLALIK